MQEFKIGDKVRIISLKASQCTFEVEGYQVGDTFTIDEIDESDFTVSPDGDSWFYMDDLELVTSPAKQGQATPAAPAVQYIIVQDSVTLMIDGNSEIATKDHKNFQAIRAHVIAEEFDEALALMNISTGIKTWGQGLLQIKDGNVLYNGMGLTGKLVERIVGQMVGGDIQFERFARFLSLTMEQPSFQTRNRLMDFAADDKLDINKLGHVVAFKSVRDDYFDKHSGTFRNMVGDSPSMPRNAVDDDHSHDCSAGLHVASPNYLKDGWCMSGKVMRVTVDPRDFVAIPHTYADSKARVCRYTVVEDITDKLADYGMS